MLAGYKVPAGAKVNCLIQNTAQCPKFFKDPMVYKPERTLRDHPDKEDIHPFANLPFGHGNAINYICEFSIKFFIGRAKKLHWSQVCNSLHPSALNKIASKVQNGISLRK